MNDDLPPQVKAALDTIRRYYGAGFHIVSLPEEMPVEEKRAYLRKLKENGIMPPDTPLFGDVEAEAEGNEKELSDQDIYQLAAKFTAAQGADFTLFTKYLPNQRLSQEKLQTLERPTVRINNYAATFWRSRTGEQDKKVTPGMRFTVGLYHEHGLTLFAYSVVEVSSDDPSDPKIIGEITGAISLLPTWFEETSHDAAYEEQVLFRLPPLEAIPANLDPQTQRDIYELLHEGGRYSFSFWDDVFNGS
jgi:hypothetical protein